MSADEATEAMAAEEPVPAAEAPVQAAEGNDDAPDDSKEGEKEDKKKGGRKGPSGPTLPRTPVSEKQHMGQVMEWKGNYGWIMPAEPIKHPKASMHQGRIFLSRTDLGNAKDVFPGSFVQFQVFEDEQGLGAEGCTVWKGWGMPKKGFGKGKAKGDKGGDKGDKKGNKGETEKLVSTGGKPSTVTDAGKGPERAKGGGKQGGRGKSDGSEFKGKGKGARGPFDPNRMPTDGQGDRKGGKKGGKGDKGDRFKGGDDKGGKGRDRFSPDDRLGMGAGLGKDRPRTATRPQGRSDGFPGMGNPPNIAGLGASRSGLPGTHQQTPMPTAQPQHAQQAHLQQPQHGLGGNPFAAAAGFGLGMPGMGGFMELPGSNLGLPQNLQGLQGLQGVQGLQALQSLAGLPALQSFGLGNPAFGFPQAQAPQAPTRGIPGMQGTGPAGATSLSPFGMLPGYMDSGDNLSGLTGGLGQHPSYKGGPSFIGQ